ncbi:MAG: NAD(P)-dependent oxidoreductase [Muribaculaceae bacterium]|nr:NAD(P)-dependent oxidoreductase [Bacteroidales bacterium]MBD5326180.1 NAD(P)-dependent oxidoreductase [Bacteroides sp.]MDE6223809.1 NAD(P)-dependent oxidoreductase [Muribaculaceae bacterium]MDE6228761.1 NAD(P)-dependent oxidoreductase [Muribaculaceae bacterium]
MTLQNEESTPYTMAEAIAEAKRCLNCKAPQCKKGCPIGNDIPDWIHELSMGNIGNAMNIINAKSNLPAVCGRVCAHERQCEGHCVMGKLGDHINIGRLERFIADFDTQMNLTRRPISAKTRGKVAVIGSGPAGITVAGELARKGFNVDIFEMEKRAGGVLTFGIPDYRLPGNVVDSEIEKIKQLGVKVLVGVTVGPDITVDGLFDNGYDAIFMGTGAGKPKALDIEGGDSKCIMQAIHFLRLASMYNNKVIRRRDIGLKTNSRVFIVGCGNTAMDAARTALRLGAQEVTVVYHRGIENMSALRAEYDEAVAEGVKFLWYSSIKSIRHNPEGTDYLLAMEVEGVVTDMPADKVIIAVGSRPASRIVSTTDGIETDENGYVITREYPFGMTTRKGVFAGGDVSGNQATVVHAMANARAVAESIASYVDAINLLRTIDQQ